MQNLSRRVLDARLGSAACPLNCALENEVEEEVKEEVKEEKVGWTLALPLLLD